MVWCVHVIGGLERELTQQFGPSLWWCGWSVSKLEPVFSSMRETQQSLSHFILAMESRRVQLRLRRMSEGLG